MYTYIFTHIYIYVVILLFHHIPSLSRYHIIPYYSHDFLCRYHVAMIAMPLHLPAGQKSQPAAKALRRRPVQVVILHQVTVQLRRFRAVPGGSGSDHFRRTGSLANSSLSGGDSLVMTNIAVENRHFAWENPQKKMPFSIAIMLNYQGVIQQPTCHSESVLDPMR